MDGWMDGWMDGCMDGWMDGWILTVLSNLMMLCNFQCWSILLIWKIVGQGPAVFAAEAGCL